MRAARRLGTGSASDFLDWLQKNYKKAGEAWKLFMKISLDMNVLRDRVALRRQFVSEINLRVATQTLDELKPLVERIRKGDPGTILLFSEK